MATTMGAIRTKSNNATARACDRDCREEVPAAAGEGEQKAHSAIMQVTSYTGAAGPQKCCARCAH